MIRLSGILALLCLGWSARLQAESLFVPKRSLSYSSDSWNSLVTYTAQSRDISWRVSQDRFGRTDVTGQVGWRFLGTAHYPIAGVEIDLRHRRFSASTAGMMVEIPFDYVDVEVSGWLEWRQRPIVHHAFRLFAGSPRMNHRSGIEESFDWFDDRTIHEAAWFICQPSPWGTVTMTAGLHQSVPRFARQSPTAQPFLRLSYDLTRWGRFPTERF